MANEPWRDSLKYLEDYGLKISTKNGGRGKRALPPKIKGKHFTNMEYLVNAELHWLIPSTTISPIYNRLSDNSYFEQVFQTLGKLGEGSYGSVIKVRSQEDNNLYAIKVSKEPFRSEYDRRMKLREVEHHHSLSFHSNVVTLYKAWEEDRFTFLQMELCKPCVEDGLPLPEPDCWNVLADILQALDHIHETSRVHFDIKVENILLGQDCLYRLSDFGLMLRPKEDVHLLKEGDAKYVAPELICGERHLFTCKADIFSLGISVLEMAGNLDLPSHGEIWSALRHNVLPYDQTKDISDDLIEVLLWMMSPDPEQRPTAKEILAFPKMKEVVQQRSIIKLRNFLIKFNNPSVEEIITFFISLAWTIAVIMLHITAFWMEESKTENLKNYSSGTKSDSSTSRGYGSAESSCYWSKTISSTSNDSVAMVADDHMQEELLSQSRPIFSSTPMAVNEPGPSNGNIVSKRLKRMRYERVSLTSDGMEQSGHSSCESPPPSSSGSPSPPPSQIDCDWVSITSPDRSVREASLVNRNRLHCPSESLLQYGISPLRLSKECKEDYREQKRLWENHLSKTKRAINLDNLTYSSLDSKNDGKRKRSMTPRNLAKSFEDVDSEELHTLKQ